MEKFDDNYPQFIRIDEERKEKFLVPLVDTPGTIFYKRTQGEVYLIAVALGFKNKIREKSKKSIDVRTYHGIASQGKLLIRVVALSEEKLDFEILRDGYKTLKIIEEFANGGIPILYDKIFHSGSSLSIEDEMWDQLKSTGQKN